MLEDKEKETKAPVTAKGRVLVGAGKLAKLTVGQFCAYQQGQGSSDGIRRLRIGKVVNITRSESSVVVHRYRPLNDSRLRVRWIPLEVSVNGAEVPSSRFHDAWFGHS